MRNTSDSFRTSAFKFSLLIILTAIVFTQYCPLINLPVIDGDQVGYFYETRESSSLSNGLRFLDYGLTRQVSKGDEILYRPLLFLLLALENHFFTFHHAYWNILNLVLYLICSGLAYLVLCRVQTPLLAFLFTLLFCTSRAPIGLEINIHLSGYLAGYILFFAFLYGLLTPAPDSPKKNLVRTWTLASLSTCAAFFYEPTLIFSVLAILLIQLAGMPKLEPQPRFNMWLIVIPLSLYFAFYFSRDFSKTTRLLFVSNDQSRHFFDPVKIMIVPKDFVIRLRDLLSEVLPKYRDQKIALLMAFFLITGFKNPLKNIRHSAFLLFASLTLAYVFFLTYMRLVEFRTYYLYLFYLLLTMTFCVVITPASLSRARRGILYLFLAILIYFNYNITSDEIQAYVNEYQPIENYYTQLEQFVDGHMNEKPFSFNIVGRDSGVDPDCEIKTGYPDDPTPTTVLPMSRILFYNHYSDTNPAYTLNWDSGLGKMLVHRNFQES